MEMKRNRTFLLFCVVIGLFQLIEGKPCPEKVRPHKTRCEMYYKCMELPIKRHVWIPQKCEKGLVFESNLKMCVLPEDDWECLLEEQRNDINETKQKLKHNLNRDSDIYIVSNTNEDSKFSLDDGRVEVILQSNISSEEDEDNDKNLMESSGDGADLNDNFLQAANRETFDKMPDEKLVNHNASSSKPPTTNIDPNLTAHLQRLSQLIDGLKKTYQNRDKEQTELRPDQLNAFLAHFNIRNKFDLINSEETQSNHKQVVLSTTPSTIYLPAHFSNISNIQKQPSNSKLNKTKLENHFIQKLMPETKVVLSSSLPSRYNSAGFSSSQIVVNRPEGSVLFSLPPYNGEGHFIEHTNTHSVQQYEHNIPKISEETLKTVLELSKQMIANQNVPNVIPNSAYYATPIIQPLFLPPYVPSRPSSNNSPFSAYYGNANTDNSDYDDHANANGKPSISNYHKPFLSQKKPEKTHGTTIIHNNVVPVHVSSTNSGEKEVVDSYGQSLGLYPPLIDSVGNKNGYTVQVTHQYENNKFVTTMRPFVTTTPKPASQYQTGQYPEPYSSENTATTVRPPLQYQPTSATIAEYYTPSPHLSDNNVNSLFRSPERYPTMQYGNLPHPIDPNRPDSTNAHYPQQLERPSSYQNSNNNSPFPAQIDPNKVKIRPNSQKVESMEMDDDNNFNDQTPFNNYGGSSFSHLNKKPLIETQNNYDNTAYINQASPLPGYLNNNFQNAYLPRPTEASYASNSGHGIHKPNFPNYNEGSQLVNIGGNFISYDAFQNNILPLIGQAGSSSNNIEVISCQAGIRQPNTTDCTRYYVCSKKDGKVLSYSCPPYTAFNQQSRICDARSYANCSPDAIVSSYTISENKRIQMEAIQAINEAKRRREEALKKQNLANLLQQYNAQLNMQPNYISQTQFPNTENESNNNNHNIQNTYAQQAAMTSSIASTTTPKPKKRKYYCKEGDKVPDQTSIYNYFVCYKNAEGVMKGKKMTCLKGLLFCPMMTSCTLPSKCT